jgi:hypothetical protein
MAMMASPMRVRTALVRKMPRWPSTVREPIAMMAPDTMEPDSAGVHVETGGKARSGDHVLEQRQPDSGDAANDQVFSSCSPTNMMGPVAKASPR